MLEAVERQVAAQQAAVERAERQMVAVAQARVRLLLVEAAVAEPERVVELEDRGADLER